MQSEFIKAVLEGTIKVADVDPTLQWGLVGGAAGGLGSAIKSIAGGEDLQTGLRRAALMGLLGAGVGAGISGGSRLLGYKPESPVEALKAKPKHPMPSVAGSAGVGALGAGGLGVLGEVTRDVPRNKGIAEFMYRGDAKHIFEEAAKKKGAPAAGPSAKHTAVNDFLAKLRGHQDFTAAGKQVPDAPVKSFLGKLMGKSHYGTKGVEHLEKAILDAKGLGNAEHAGHLQDLLNKLKGGDEVLKMAPAEGRNISRLMEIARTPKGLLGAGAALGLTHLGVSNLVHNLRKK